MDAHLVEHYRIVKSYSKCFNDFHTTLVPFASASNSTKFPPSIFELSVTLMLHTRALSIDTQFSMAVDLPKPESYLKEMKNPLIAVLLEGLADLKVEVPLHCDKGNVDHQLVPISSSEINEFCNGLFLWIEATLDVVTETSTLTACNVSGEHYLFIARCLAYIRFSSQEKRLHRLGESLYMRVHFVMHITAVHRYCKNVLAPILEALSKSTARQGPELRGLLDVMKTSLKQCISHCESVFAVSVVSTGE
jgi:hypothetical protein